MSTTFAERALLPEGWAQNIRFEISADGVLAEIRLDANADGVERLGDTVLLRIPNPHSHAFQRAIAGLAGVADSPNDSFWTWRGLMCRMVVRLLPEQIEVIAHQLYIGMLKADYTAMTEFHYIHHGPDDRSYADPAELSLCISRAASAAGIGPALLPMLYSHAGFGGQPASEGQRRFINGGEAYLELLQRLYVPLDTAGRSLGLCFHSLRAVTPQQIATALAADHGDLLIHIHIAEQQKEVDDCLAWNGRQPLQWLYENVVVDQRWCLIHATHADSGEVAVIARSGAVAGLCLSTEANLGDGVFPATDFLAQGRRLDIGSDSHVPLSVVEGLRRLECDQRPRDRRRNRLYRDDQPVVGRTFCNVTLAGGTQALGQPIGSLAVGRRADLLMLNGSDPYLANAEGDALLNCWLFVGNDRQVRDVMVIGRWVIRDSQHTGEKRSTRVFVQVLGELLD